jgi:glycosyltransferase involved in cell wall biosynthesis
VKICAIIPVHNCERYIGAAIESVLAQTRPVDDILVVDACSSDGTNAVLDRFGERIRSVRLARSGPNLALNEGVARTNAEILTFLDADDLWLPEKNERQSQVLAADPSAEAIFGAVRQFVSPDLLKAGKAARMWDAQPGVSKITLMIRRAAFERVGRFDESLSVVDFVEWYTRAATSHLRAVMLEEVVTLRRRHDANVGIVKRKEQRREVLLSLKRHLDRRRQEDVRPPISASATS